MICNNIDLVYSVEIVKYNICNILYKILGRLQRKVKREILQLNSC